MIQSANGLKVQALHKGLKFVVGHPQIAFGVGDTVVVQFVHDERQVYPAHARMVPPGLAKAMGSKVAVQTHISADRCDELPALPAFDRMRIIVVFGIEENEVLLLLPDPRVSSQVFFQGFLDAIVDDHLLSFAPFLFLDPKALPDMSLVIYKMPYL